MGSGGPDNNETKSVASQQPKIYVLQINAILQVNTHFAH